MWQDLVISEKNMDLFKELIPDYCVEPLKNKSMYGLAVINRDSDVNPVVGVVLYSLTQGYIEIEWAATTAAYDLPDHGADMVRLIVNKARINGGFRGVFATFREGDMMEKYFPEYEFTLLKEPARVYRFRLCDVKKIGTDEQNGRLKNCVPLAGASEELKNDVLKCADDDGQILPLTEPVNWNIYEPDLSAVYRNEKGAAEGLVLIGDDADSDAFAINLLYSKNSLAAITLLDYSFNTAMKKYGKDQEIACPVLTKVSEGLVKKMVNDPRRETQVRAQTVFPVGTGLLSDFNIYSA